MPKVYEGAAIRALYAQLVEDFGGVDAAAALLRCNKGGISKEVNGSASIPPAHFCALEDALGRFPITDMLHARVDRSAEMNDIERLVLTTLREAGDIGPALFRAISHGERATAVKECREAHEALGQVLAALEGGAE